MSFDNPYDTLSYDEKILSDKLGLAYNSPDLEPRPAISMEHRIRKKLKENAIITEQVRKEMRDVIDEKRNPRERENMTTRHVRHSEKCGCSSYKQAKNNDEWNSEEFLNNKTLTVMVIVLAVCCVVQYMNQQTMTNSMDRMMKAMCQLVVRAPTPHTQEVASSTSTQV